MKKFSYAIASLLVAFTASAVTPMQIRHDYERPSGHLLEINQMQAITEIAPINHAEFARSANIQSKSVTAQRTDLTLGDLQPKAENNRHKVMQKASKSTICYEDFQKFTDGELNNPYGPINGSNGVIPAKYHHANSSNLLGFGVYSAGGYSWLIASSSGVNQYPSYIIQGVDLTQDVQFDMSVAAANGTSAIQVAIIDPKDKSNYVDLYTCTDIPANGYIYDIPFNISKISGLSNAWLMVYETNDQPMVFVSLDVYHNNTTSGGGGTGGGGTVDPGTGGSGDVAVGDVTNVTYSTNRLAFTVNWTDAPNATTHELKVYNDVFVTNNPVASYKVLDKNYSDISVGTTDPYAPNTANATMEVAYTDKMPGGMIHNPVFIDGALGFICEPAITDNQQYLPGFRTDIYDINATEGIADLFIRYYATDGAAIIIYECAFNKTTGEWDVVDSGFFNESNGGLMIETDEGTEWDYLNITFEQRLDMNKYSGEVFFMVGLDSDYAEEYPKYDVFFYISELSLTYNNIPTNSAFYYTYYDNPKATSGQQVTGAVNSNYYHFTVRGLNTADGKVSFGNWYNNPETRMGTIYTRYPTGIEQIRENARAANGAAAEYFNLQGVRVANPTESELYIVRRGDSVTKEIFK